MGMLNILGLTRFLTLGTIGQWPIVPVAIGAWPYPITFLCTDLISELWGSKKPRSWFGWGCCSMNGGVHPLAGWTFATAPMAMCSSLLQRLAFGAVGASMVAYMVAQFTDVRLFHFWKRLTNGRAHGCAINGSTFW